MKLLRADHKIEMRKAGEQDLRRAPAPCSRESRRPLQAPFRELPQHPHFAECFLIRHVAHAAGVEQDDVGFALMSHRLVTSLQK